MRILIIGNCGVGKSVLAERLGRELSLSVSHLDLITWTRNFRRVPEPIFRQKLSEIMKGRGAIVEGWGLQSTMKERIIWAQVVIYLCYPKSYCLRAVSERNLAYHNKANPYDNFDGDRSGQAGFYSDLINRIHDEYEPEVQIWLKELEERKMIFTFYNRDDVDTNYPAMLSRIQRQKNGRRR